jgi:hypothetical protein
MQLLIKPANFRTTPRRENDWARKGTNACYSIPTWIVCQLCCPVFVVKANKSCIENQELSRFNERQYRYPYRHGQSPLKQL